MHAVGACSSKQAGTLSALSLAELSDMSKESGDAECNPGCNPIMAAKDRHHAQPCSLDRAPAPAQPFRKQDRPVFQFFKAQTTYTPVKLLACGGTAVVWLCK